MTSLNYYTYAFDVSGYGEAARGTIKALQTAGVRVHVINTGGRGDPKWYPWIAALQGFDPKANFNLFHNIASLWPQHGWPHGQDITKRIPTIGMTVWETDTVPSRWLPILSQAVDVWLPSRYNCDVFYPVLNKPTFCLPHPVSVFGIPPDGPVEALEGVQDNDYVFYSIFDWQDRKNPLGLIQAFLQAFPNESKVVLFIKTKAGVNQQAIYHAVQHIRRSHPHAITRIIVKYGIWEEAQLRALHARGDCYVSLHCSEGWGYPLFDAACLGKPVVATHFGGALDYLDSLGYWLVTWREAPVLQSYVDYDPAMQWALPNCEHAVAGLRWVYENREFARQQAGLAAAKLHQRYGLHSIGQLARHRLDWLQSLKNVSRETMAPAAPQKGGFT